MHHDAPPEITHLSNGIPVLLQDAPGAVATTYWWIDEGSTSEGKNEEGFAHFLEHMLFKDAAAKETGKASTGQTARAIESLGGDINAYTSFDQTVYHVTCAQEHWERVIDLFGIMAKPQKFLKLDFEREREVILEELRKTKDSPGRQFFSAVFETAYAKHPYGREVIGFEKTLKKANVKQLEKFYRARYNSTRMGLILVGPLGEPARRKKVLAALEKRYGKQAIPPLKKLVPAVKKISEPETRAVIGHKVLKFDVQTPSLALAFRVPDIHTKDLQALEVLAGIIGMGELSRVYQELFYKQALVTEASGSLYIPKDPGLLFLQAEFEKTENAGAVLNGIFKVLSELREGAPDHSEVERVITNIESEKLYATQSVDGLASRIGYVHFVIGNIAYDDTYFAKLKRVTPEDVRAVARKYLTWNRMTGVLMIPKKVQAPDFKSMLALAKNSLPDETSSKVRRPTHKPIQHHKLFQIKEWKTPGGMQVVLHERPNSHAISVHSATLGGLRSEITQPIRGADQDWGASYLMAMTWTKGTKKKTAHDISRIVEGSAAHLDGYAGRNTVGLEMTGLARDWTRLSELYSEVLAEPTFDTKELEHSKRVTEDAIKGIEDHSSQICSKLFLETLFESHPYGRITLGSIDSLKVIDSEVLQGFYRKWVTPSSLTLAVSGAVREDEVVKWALALDQRLSARKARTIETVAEESVLKAPRWVERNLGREQVHILVGGLGMKVDSPERHAYRLLQTILGGQSGRLFIELREKKSLAYTVSPVSFEGVEPGYVGTYIACARDKRDEAIKGIGVVLETLASRGPTSQEIERAKEFLLGRRAMELQSDSSLAAYFGLQKLYGLEIRDNDELRALLDRITAKEIQGVCRRYLVEPFHVTSVVG